MVIHESPSTENYCWKCWKETTCDCCCCNKKWPFQIPIIFLVKSHTLQGTSSRSTLWKKDDHLPSTTAYGVIFFEKCRPPPRVGGRLHLTNARGLNTEPSAWTNPVISSAQIHRTWLASTTQKPPKTTHTSELAPNGASVQSQGLGVRWFLAMKSMEFPHSLLQCPWIADGFYKSTNSQLSDRKWWSETLKETSPTFLEDKILEVWRISASSCWNYTYSCRKLQNVNLASKKMPWGTKLIQMASVQSTLWKKIRFREK